MQRYDNFVKTERNNALIFVKTERNNCSDFVKTERKEFVLQFERNRIIAYF